MFIPDLTALSFGDFLSIIVNSIYIFDYIESTGQFFVMTLVVIIIVVSAVIVGYLLYATLTMKKDITAMGTVLNQEGEVTELLNDFGKKGWINIYGENWRFRSKEPLRVGDYVRVIKERKMDLIVEKIDDPNF